MADADAVCDSDVIATGTIATHALYSKVSIHEAPEALHDMAFTVASAR